MIFKILNAYEEELRNQNSFFQAIEKMNKKTKIVFAIWIVSVLGSVGVAWITHSGKVISICMLICFVATLWINSYLDSDKRKNYIKDARKYNERLSQLDKLLRKEEFAINSEKKLSALINKMKTYLNTVEKQEEKRQKNNKDFYTGIIIPIGTYILGRLVEKDNSFGLVQNIIILLFVVLYIRFIINEFSREWKLLFQSDETKMKYLLDELQDLYDRDYL